ncbi:MAG: glycosyltransferase family 39 protein [Mucispirillum sp.]|nr:glycosyltransferase family 39 protein [Mucispirillum sp.]
MLKIDKSAVYFLIAAAAFQCLCASGAPIREDEAYLYLKSVSASWTMLPFSGLGELITGFAAFTDESSFALRIPSIVFASLGAAFIFMQSQAVSGKFAAWISMVSFLIIPAVNYAFVSVTPAGALIFFASLSLFCWNKGFNEKNVKYYIAAAFSASLAFFTDISGAVFIIIPIIYSFFKRELLREKYFIFSVAACVLFAAILTALHFAGYFTLFNKYPAAFTPKNYLAVSFVLSVLPALYVLFIAVIKKSDTGDKFLFYKAAFFVSVIAAAILTIFTDIDIRCLAALMVPAAILFGCFFEIYGYKIFAGFIMAVTAAVSVYSNINDSSNIIPNYLKGKRIYEALKFPMEGSLYAGSALYAKDAGLASVLAFNMAVHPEACTVRYCSKSDGVFVSEEKNDTLTDFFENVTESGVYRLSDIKDGRLIFHFYNVSGLKKEKNDR